MTALKIEMIHDFVCSWCAIGYQNIQRALKDLKVDAEFTYLPSELNPDLGDEGIEIKTYFKQRYGWSDSQYDRYRRQVMEASEAAGAGIDFQFRTHYYNTNLAHRLLMEAQPLGLAKPLYEALLHAYHSEGKNIGDVHFLKNAATAAGVSESFFDECFFGQAQKFDSGQALNRELDCEADSQAYLRALRRRSLFEPPSVPAFVFNRTELIVGSNSPSFFRTHIKRLLQKSTTSTIT